MSIISEDRSIPLENEIDTDDSNMLDKTCVELENVGKPLI